MKRGEVWDADVGGKAGRRPIVVLTRSSAIPYLSKVVVAEVTTKGKGYPSQVPIGQEGNLPRESWVSAESLYSLPKDRLLRYRGELSEITMRRVSDAVIFALELS
ncbi:MAG: type II toxin-antitoxin system PemK/MazF family toxin [Deltaproteobacteria bacterium]|nr:type II toxin-antitoxin system PemK/MazF family toxin [Deltaproteobacteria bacterium]